MEYPDACIEISRLEVAVETPEMFPVVNKLLLDADSVAGPSLVKDIGHAVLKIAAGKRIFSQEHRSIQVYIAETPEASD